MFGRYVCKLIQNTHQDLFPNIQAKAKEFNMDLYAGNMYKYSNYFLFSLQKP